MAIGFSQHCETHTIVQKASPATEPPWTTIVDGIVSPEGPAVDKHGTVFLVSRWTGRVLKVDLARQHTELVQTGGKPQSVALLPSGELLVADAKNHALLKITREGQLTIICDNVNGDPLLGPNDLVIGPDNIVYMTDPGLDMEAPGQVLRIDLNNGNTTVIVQGLLFPNGIALSDDARQLFVAESTPHRVWRYPVIDNGRTLGSGEVFHQFDDYYPDGLALDAVGNLLVALHGSGLLTVLSPEGDLIDSILTGGRGCTNCVFGGEDFQTLYLTEDDQRALLAMRWPRPGQRNFSRSLS